MIITNKKYIKQIITKGIEKIIRRTNNTSWLLVLIIGLVGSLAGWLGSGVEFVLRTQKLFSQ